MADNREIEYHVLAILGRAKEPLGSGAISDGLRQAGQTVSEATAGRILRELDYKGYTCKFGFRGRALTNSGQVRLDELERQRRMQGYSNDLLTALKVSERDQLIELLVARRAIEREVAHLAAERCTPENLAEIERKVAAYGQAADAPAAAEADLEFHQALAAVAGNRVLQAATHLMHAEAQALPIPPEIAQKMRPEWASDHWAIVDALRANDPVGAEQAMVRHIERIIESIKTLWPEPH